MAIVDEYVLPPNITPACIKAPRAGQKKASEYITDGNRLKKRRHPWWVNSKRTMA